MTYNFDEPVDRQGSNSVKYDLRKEVFGNDKVLPMWVADMDFRTPPFIISAIEERLEHPLFGYTFRDDEYFNSLIDWVAKRYSWQIEKEWISFSPGIVPALNLCTLAYTEPGDSVIVQPPVYFPFFTAVKDHGRKLMFNRLKYDDGSYGFDLEGLEEKAALGAKMLILSNPHNPVGRAWRENELRGLAEICLKHNITIISDEIHSDLVLPGFKHIPLASLSEEIAAITVSCMAPSKTFNLAGLSTSSMIISNEELRSKFNKKIESMHISGGNIFGTIASIAAYRHGEEWLGQLLGYLDHNAGYLIERFEGFNSYIKPVKPEATYMVWLDCKGMNMTDEELKEFFINRAGVGMNDGPVFGPGGEGFMRINLATPLSNVEKAADQIEKALKTI